MHSRILNGNVWVLIRICWIWKEWLRISQFDNRLLPNPLWLVSQQLVYLMPWYDPVHEGSTDDALHYLDHSQAAKRATLKVA